jgi:hypothetical protein
MRWAVHLILMGEMRNAYTILVGKPKWKSLSEDLSVDGNIMSKRILGGEGGKVWTGFNWLRIETSSSELL